MHKSFLADNDIKLLVEGNVDNHNNQSNDSHIDFKKLALLYKQSSASAILNMIIASLLVAILWENAEQAYLISWLLAMSIIAFTRVGISAVFFKRTPETINLTRWQYVYFTTLIVIAGIWGLGTAAMLPNLSPVYQGTIFFFLMGMGGGFLVAHSVYRLHIVTFMPILLLPSIVIIMFEGGGTMKLLALTTFIFMLAGMNATRILTKMLHQNFLLTQKLNEAKLEAEKLANVDALTNMNNRRAFLKLTQQQISLCERVEKPISLIMADVDNFKSINDTYGHEVGDKALVFIANMIKSNQRNADVSARVGGEEFVVFLADTSGEDAKVYAERLRKNIEENALILNGVTLNLSVSMGIASNLYNVEQLLGCADKAMYQAKHQGKNQVVELSGRA